MQAIAIMAVGCLLAGLTTSQWAYSVKGQRTMLLLTLAVLSAIYFQFYAAGQLFWAEWVSSSAAIIYTNMAAVLAALAAGWAWRLPKIPPLRRAVLTLLLSLMCLATLLWPLLSIAVRPPPLGGNRWHNGVAMQTSWATCSPAAAATLFRALNIDTSEAELVPLCLTDSSGTPTLGLYRGVKLIAQREARATQIVNRSLDKLLTANAWPVLLAVELPYGTEDRRYAEQWGWIPGMGHSVVVLDRTPDGGVLVADPSVGLERWTVADLRLLWHGDGIRVY